MLNQKLKSHAFNNNGEPFYVWTCYQIKWLCRQKRVHFSTHAKKVFYSIKFYDAVVISYYDGFLQCTFIISKKRSEFIWICCRRICFYEFVHGTRNDIMSVIDEVFVTEAYYNLVRHVVNLIVSFKSTRSINYSHE